MVNWEITSKTVKVEKIIFNLIIQDFKKYPFILKHNKKKWKVEKKNLKNKEYWSNQFWCNFMVINFLKSNYLILNISNTQNNF